MDPVRVLDVGQCTADHSRIRRLIEGRFVAEVERAPSIEDALERLESGDYALVLVNRKLDRDGSDGVELIEKMKTREGTERIPVMLVSNYAEAQAVALKRGAEPGFGKNDLNDTETLESLAQYLPQRRSDSSG